MEIISKISKGSKMDQIYIPKNRMGFSIGSHVIIKPLELENPTEKPYFYNIHSIEPVKLKLVDEIFKIISNTTSYDNIIITGSFLDSGFNFEDIDILIIYERKLDITNIKKKIENIWREIYGAGKCKAFLKGIFDAEGNINFSSTRRGREIKITNTDKEIIYLIRFCLRQLKIPSRITLAKGYRPNRKACFNIKTYGKSSIKFLKTVRPYKIFSENYLEGKVHPDYFYLFQ